MVVVVWVLLVLGFYYGLLLVVDIYEYIYSLVGVYDVYGEGYYFVEEGFNNILFYYLGKIVEIFIFLIGVMMIVEIIDLYCGFEVLKSYVKIKSKWRLFWIVGMLGFIFLAIIDNLIVMIVLVMLLCKIVLDKKECFWFVVLIVIVVNVGGVWLFIGDVIIIMFWIGNKVLVGGLIEYFVVFFIVCFVVLFMIVVYFMKLFCGDIMFDVDENI